MVARYPNVYLDTVHVFARITASWATEQDRQAIWARLRDGVSAFPDRIMFGTDHPSGTGHLADMYGDVRAFGSPAALEAKLLRDNAVALMRARRDVTPGPSAVAAAKPSVPARAASTSAR